MRRALVAAVVLGGCNGLFGLDATSPESADADHDGVEDGLDNCRGVANPGQEDRDGDTVGDLCDPFPDGLACATGMPIDQDMNGDGIDDGCQSCTNPGGADEDGDGQPDTCDRCPGLAGTQADADSDGVGDDCDLSSDRQSRLRFDGFDIDGPPSTALFGATGWKAVGGILNTDAIPAELVPALAGGVTGDWSLSLGLLLPETSEDGHTIEIRIFDPTMAQKPASCAVIYDAQKEQWSGLAQACCGATAKTPFPFTRKPAGNTLRAFLVEKEGTFHTFCEVVGGGGTDILVSFANAPVHIQLAMSVASRLTYVDLVR